MKILAIGDSFTYGSELPDASTTIGEGDSLIYEHPSDVAWPSLLAKEVSGTVNNLGLPGGSNGRIFRLAISESLKEKYDIVICAWSNAARLDVQYNGKDFPVTPSSSAWIKQRITWIDEYYTVNYNKKHAIDTWMSQILALQNFFKYNKQKYLFLNVESNEICPGFRGGHKDKVYPEFKKLETFVDSNYYIGWPQYGIVDWMGDCPKGPGGHPLELGHKRIAEKINEHIRNFGWVS